MIATTNRPTTKTEGRSGRAMLFTPSENSRYAGDLPLCKRCNFHHTGPCTGKCKICNKVGHLSKNCRNKKPTNLKSKQLPVSKLSVHVSVEIKGYYYKSVPQTNINAQGRAIHCEMIRNET
ncbi:reverse transcriptase domain-containing protein [Tanacetum coccineum]